MVVKEVILFLSARKNDSATRKLVTSFCSPFVSRIYDFHANVTQHCRSHHRNFSGYLVSIFTGICRADQLF